MRTKPIVLVRFSDKTKNESFNKLYDVIKQLGKALGKHYYVLAVPDTLDISVLNGLSFELSEEQLNELQSLLIK